jgi:MoaA/NifB/PqqE/SkfB family radical SAM enzyme
MRKSSQNNSPPRFISGFAAAIAAWLMMVDFILLIICQYPNPGIARQVMRALKQLKNDYFGEARFSRLLLADGKVYFNFHMPGFPSAIMKRVRLGELNRIRPVRAQHSRFRLLFLNITNNCPLRCKHCYEWHNLNKPGQLPAEEYKAILAGFAAQGIGQVHIGGGEPLMNYPTLLEIVKFLDEKSETYIATSGVGLSYERAVELKQAGLTGAAISVDHYIADHHNEFRGSPKAFELAMEATENSLRAGLITCWSICVTREFLASGSIDTYAAFAASRGVHFIQLLDPFPSGRFEGLDVSLDISQYKLLEEFYLGYNRANVNKHHPLVVYPGYHQRRMGCMGNGNYYLFIDTWGNLHSCPMCRNDRQLNSLLVDPEAVAGILESSDCRAIRPTQVHHAGPMVRSEN